MRHIADIPGEEVEIAVDRLTVRFLRARGLEAFVDADSLLRSEAAPEPPYWMYVWPGAVALSRLLANAPEVGPGVRLLELGCGLALPSLVARLRGARVVASDWKREPLQFARVSAQLNAQALDLIQMDWNNPALEGNFDVCVGADIGYDEVGHIALVRGLRNVVRPGGVTWFADSVNTFRSTLVAELRAARFAVAVSSIREHEDGRPVSLRLIEARRLA